MIYADNAATTQMGEAAINAMTACMRDTWGNPSSLYGLGQRAKETLEDARERIAACIGAFPKEITFTSGGSEADNQAIFCPSVPPPYWGRGGGNGISSPPPLSTTPSCTP